MRTPCFRFVFAVIIILGIPSFVIAQEKLKIAVIPKSNTAIFWKSVHQGSKLGTVSSGGVELLWRAPSKDDDLQEQISLVDQCVNNGVSGIALAPMDREALTGAVAKAAKKKIPVLIFDSALKGTPGKDFFTIVGIDNKKGGNIAGEEMAKLIGGRGKVVLLRVKVGNPNIMSREDGFLETLAKYKGIQVIEKNRYVSGTVEETMAECMKMTDKLNEADGIFCSYEQSTIGMCLALRNLNLAGKVKFVGFDTPALALEALKKNEISALVAQDPAQMGFLCVKTLVDHIHGKKIPMKINIDVRVITRDNLNDPDIQKLLALPSMTE
jgi:ribose transport system substrate-binding protein